MQYQFLHNNTRTQEKVTLTDGSHQEIKTPLNVVTLSKEEMIRKLRTGSFKGMKLCAYNPADSSLKEIQI